MTCSLRSLVLSIVAGLAVPAWSQDRLTPITYNNPGLIVDLGVGLWAWPLPMDYDGDGDMDLVVSCPDKPFNGVYFFENPGTAKSSKELPVFKPPVRLGPAVQNIQISHADGKERLLAPGVEYLNFRQKVWGEQAKLGVPAKIDPEWKRYRANQWKAVDWDGDGAQDLLIGIEIWDDYGWDDAWDKEGNWKNGPLHGFVFFVRNEGTDAKPKYAAPVKLESNGKPIDVFGMPGPSAADFDGDGDLDLICGEFLDGFTYFENIGTRTEPKLAEGRRLTQSTLMRFGSGGNKQMDEAIARSCEIRMDLQMITPTAVDWDGDGDIDLICGDEDGRVALIENTGEVSAGMPQFKQPRYFQQEAADVKFGALAAPFGVDWDGDGDDDILCGNTAGYIAFIENLGGGANPVWAARLLNQFGQERLSLGQPLPLNEILLPNVPARPVRQQAGPKGSIQGPCEAKWGYSTLSVADWNHDGVMDVVANGIWGKVHWHAGFDNQPSFDRKTVVTVPQPVQVQWEGTPQEPEWSWWTPDQDTLATQWRTTPCAVDWNGDGLTDLVMLDHDGYLVFFERSKPADGPTQKVPPLMPPKRIFKMEGPCEFDSRHKAVGEKKDDLLRLNANRIGASGRRKLHVVDWDGDGRLDLLVNSINANWLRNVRTDDDGFVWLQDMGPLDDVILTGHDTAPATVDWDKNGIPDLLIGAEDGRLYYKRNPRAIAQTSAKSNTPADGPVLVSEFIYETAPFPSCHASTIAETPSGLVAAWFGGTREKDKDVGIWVSRHVNGQWSPVVEVANGVQHSTLRHPCWNPVLYVEPGIGKDGRSTALHLFYKCGPDPKTWWGMHTISFDDGASWSTPVRLPEGIDGPVKNKPVTLSTGELLSGSSTEYDGWRLHFEIAADWGRPRHNGTQLLTKWDRIGPVNDGQEFNAIQPSILLHGGSKLQILCRSKEGSILTSWSEDNGRSWSPVERTSLPNNNSGTDAVTMADGRHVLIYNHTQKGRSPLNVAISEDGKNWQAALVLESEPGEYSYPAVIQTKDGLLHFTYTWKRQKIKHAVVDPQKLELQPIVEGTWPTP